MASSLALSMHNHIQLRKNEFIVVLTASTNRRSHWLRAPLANLRQVGPTYQSPYAHVHAAGHSASDLHRKFRHRPRTTYQSHVSGSASKYPRKRARFSTRTSLSHVLTHSGTPQCKYPHQSSESPLRDTCHLRRRLPSSYCSTISALLFIADRF